MRAVARHELRRILQREGITRRNLVVEIDDAALDVVLARGYDPRYGARALKRELQRQLVLPLAMTLMERAVDPGAILRVADRDGQLRVRVIDTADSRAHRREQAPVEVEPGRKLDGDALRAAVDAVSATVAALAKRVDEPHLLVERDRLVELRAEPDFWRDPRAAARDLRDLDRVNETLDRLDALRVRRDALVEVMAGADSRRRKADAANRLGQLEAAVARAARELWAMGPDGRWDALVEIAPIGPEGRLARDLLVEVYRGWARGRAGAAEWLFEPRDDAEPALLAIKGPYPFGYLRLEAGLHRVRRGEDHGAARVRLAPWTDADDPVRFGEHRALKAEGQFGGPALAPRLRRRPGAAERALTDRQPRPRRRGRPLVGRRRPTQRGGGAPLRPRTLPPARHPARPHHRPRRCVSGRRLPRPARPPPRRRHPGLTTAARVRLGASSHTPPERRGCQRSAVSFQLRRGDHTLCPVQSRLERAGRVRARHSERRSADRRFSARPAKRRGCQLSAPPRRAFVLPGRRAPGACRTVPNSAQRTGPG